MISNIEITDRQVTFLLDDEKETEISFDPYYFELWAKKMGYFEVSGMIMKGNEYVDDQIVKYDNIHEFVEDQPAKIVEETFMEYWNELQAKKHG